MNPLQHIECIQELGALTANACKLDFPAFGCLYRNTSALTFATIPVDSEYCIGPHCAPQYWGDISGSLAAVPRSRLHQGPWNSLADYLEGQLSRTRTNLLSRGLDVKSAKALLSLTETYEQLANVITQADRVKAACRPVLTHPDFHTRNIFVNKDDPTKVTGLIDWQHAAVNPAFIAGTETPDFGELLFFDKELDQTKSQEQLDVADDA
ncbi:hypothetical protein LTR95_000845 [Oleoguttula sp. CCFEE 5521]